MPRRSLILAVFLLLLALTFLQLWRHPTVLPKQWRPPTAAVAPSSDLKTTVSASSPTSSFAYAAPPTATSPLATPAPSSPAFSPQRPSYSDLERVLVVARQKQEDVSWIQTELPDITSAVYVVDDPDTTLHVPANKGHEAMVYLTFIIDHYDDLPALSIFVHSHQSSWHNNDLLDSDMPRAVRRLNADYVQKEGYMNLRCHMQPGCSDNLHLDATEKDNNKPEVTIFREVWDQIHPGKPLPKTLSAPCCAQFAVSRDRIRSISRQQYVTWRDWLIDSDLESGVSGRIWEYTWHYIFTGKADLCPTSHVCYCGGFGVCFKSAATAAAWFDTREEMRKLQDQGREDKSPDEARKEEREAKIERMREELEAQRVEALQLGLNPDLRREALAA